jgi:hypothetical protein
MAGLHTQFLSSFNKSRYRRDGELPLNRKIRARSVDIDLDSISALIDSRRTTTQAPESLAPGEPWNESK